MVLRRFRTSKGPLECLREIVVKLGVRATLARATQGVGVTIEDTQVRIRLLPRLFVIFRFFDQLSCLGIASAPSTTRYSVDTVHMALISFPPDLHLYNACPPGFPINRRASTLIRFLLDQVGKVGKGTRYFPGSQKCSHEDRCSGFSIPRYWTMEETQWSNRLTLRSTSDPSRLTVLGWQLKA